VTSPNHPIWKLTVNLYPYMVSLWRHKPPAFHVRILTSSFSSCTQTRWDAHVPHTQPPPTLFAGCTCAPHSGCFGVLYTMCVCMCVRGCAQVYLIMCVYVSVHVCAVHTETAASSRCTPFHDALDSDLCVCVPHSPVYYIVCVTPPVNGP